MDRLAAGLERNLKTKYEFQFVAPTSEDYYLTKIPGCFARLRMFDPNWQEAHGINEGDRIVQIDVDTIITGSLDDLFNRTEDFVIMQGGNYQPCPYNGALWMQRAFTNGQIWNDFSLDAARKIKFHEFPDDQGWLWNKLPGAAGWKCGDEVFVFQKPGWPLCNRLPDKAKIVTFAGSRRPDQIANLEWVKQHWIS